MMVIIVSNDSVFNCRFKQYQLDLQTSLSSLMKTRDNIEEFTNIKQQCDQTILQLSTEVLHAKNRASTDSSVESIEAALSDLSLVRAQADDIYNSIVSMETLVYMSLITQSYRLSLPAVFMLSQ